MDASARYHVYIRDILEEWAPNRHGSGAMGQGDPRIRLIFVENQLDSIELIFVVVVLNNQGT